MRSGRGLQAPGARASRALLILVTAWAMASPGRTAGLSGPEHVLLARIDVQRSLRTLRYLSQDLGSRDSGLGPGTVLSGSAEEHALGQFIAARMRAAGLAVHLEPFPVRAYRYGPVQLTANGRTLEAISLQAAAGTWGVRDGLPYAHGTNSTRHVVAGDLVDVQDGYAADYARGGDVRGRIVLVHREMHDWPEAQITEAAWHGAAGIIFYDYPGSSGQLDALRQDSMWGHEQIPAVAITRRGADTLRVALTHGPVHIALENRADVGDGVSHNVIGVLRGTRWPGEWVVVGAHYDRWFEGAGDNTSGVAELLEAARVLAHAGRRPLRSIAFLATGSEEAGLADPERDWLAGSYAFVRAHPEVMRHAALAFNLDLVGWTSSKGTLMTSPDFAPIQRDIVQDLGFADRLEIVTPTSSAIDAWNYGVVGGAAVTHLWRATSSGPQAYFPLYHTQLDVFDPARFENLGPDLQLIVLTAWRAANITPLPVHLSAVADFVRPLLEADARKVPEVDFDPTLRALEQVRAAAAALEASGQGAGGPARAIAQQHLLQSLRHDLVPWLYISDGDFQQAVRTAENARRVAVLDRVLAALEHGNVQAARAALGEIYEGRMAMRLSPEVYRAEHAFWISRSGWASEFVQRPAPPGRSFDQGCTELARPDADLSAAVKAFAAARNAELESVADALRFLQAQLDQAGAQLAH